MSMILKGNSGINFKVDIVDDLLTLEGSEGEVVIVSEENRGGTFVYRSAESGVNNGGTIFNGWCRQYDGAVNVRWFGAKGDGVTDDTDAIQRALATGLNVFVPLGSYVITDELTMVTAGQKLFGEGGNTHYSVGMGDDSQYQHPCVERAGEAQQASVFIVKDPTDAGVRYVKTRMKYRASSADPEDSPLSTVINVQEDAIRIEDIVVRLHLDNVPIDLWTDTSTNLGADWDVGIFIGSRLHTHLKNVSVVGYFREASIWVDVSHCQYPQYPRFKDYRTNVPFPTGQGIAGGDGTEFHNVFTFGGRWGCRVQGGEPLDYNNYDYGNPYYDEITGATLTDRRGSFGFSDFLVVGCEFYGPDHHTKWRLYDMKANPSIEDDLDVGGAYSISGLASNPSRRLQGHTYISTRFSTKAPFKVRLHGTHRDTFIGCHMENFGLEGSYDATGNLITDDGDTVSFGNIAKSTTAKGIRLISTNAYTYSRWFDVGLNDSIIAPHNTDDATRTGTNILVNNDPESGSNGYIYNYAPNGGTAGYNFSTADDNFEASLRYYEATKELQYRLNTYSGFNGAAVCSTTTDGTDVKDTFGGAYSVIASRFTYKDRYENDLFRVFLTGNAEMSGNLRPMVDVGSDLGTASLRWGTIYASTGTINTSDAREKTFSDIPEVETQVAKELKSLVRRFKFNDAIELKGEENARIHYGASAQEVIAVFEKYGLDAMEYAMVCYDEWEEERDEEGNVTVEAGNRYGIRYEELIMFILGAM